jgi:hypothetical protein
MLAEPCGSGQRNVTATKLVGWLRNVILKQEVTLEIMRPRTLSLNPDERRSTGKRSMRAV